VANGRERDGITGSKRDGRYICIYMKNRECNAMQLNEQAKSGGVPVAAAAQREKRVRPLKKLN